MSSVDKQGIEKSRIPAVATCKARGWEEGDVLVSSSWKTPKHITKFMGKFVRINAAQYMSGGDRVHTFPADVTKVDNEKTI